MRVLVIAHVFYPQFWPELASCIRNITEQRDIVVTFVDEASVVEARRDFPEAKFLKCENRGFDIWPFICALRTVDLGGYDAVVKLHTKRDIDFGFDFRIRNRSVSGSAWRNLLLLFCRTPSAWRRTQAVLEDSGVGMVAERHLIVRRRDVPYGHAYAAFDEAEREMRTAFGPGASVARLQYVAGTMFAARAAVLREFLVRMPLKAVDFPESAHVGTTDCQYAHAVERMLGFAVTWSGLRIEPFNPSVFTRFMRMLASVVTRT